ncbi:MAG: hypothetical protein K2I81_01900, partial [Alphaproteobacteria bacterium]|nr:hypothetical protein [Alphaproteobacteria bacterium]
KQAAPNHKTSKKNIDTKQNTQKYFYPNNKLLKINTDKIYQHKNHKQTKTFQHKHSRQTKPRQTTQTATPPIPTAQNYT